MNTPDIGMEVKLFFKDACKEIAGDVEDAYEDLKMLSEYNGVILSKIEYIDFEFYKDSEGIFIIYDFEITYSYNKKEYSFDIEGITSSLDNEIYLFYLLSND